MRSVSANPRGRSYKPIDWYITVMVDAAAVMLDPEASPNRREQAHRRFDLLHCEAARRWPSAFAPTTITFYEEP